MSLCAKFSTIAYLLFFTFLLRKRQICNTYNKILWDLWCEIEMYKDNKCWTIHSKEKIEKRILVLKHFHSDHVYVQHVTDRRVLFCLCSFFFFLFLHISLSRSWQRVHSLQVRTFNIIHVINSQEVKIAEWLKK